MSEKCGTYAGYNEHVKQGTSVCAPCMKARSGYTRDWRRRTGRTKGSWLYVPEPHVDEIEKLLKYRGIETRRMGAEQ